MQNNKLETIKKLENMNIIFFIISKMQNVLIMLI